MHVAERGVELIPLARVLPTVTAAVVTTYTFDPPGRLTFPAFSPIVNGDSTPKYAFASLSIVLLITSLIYRFNGYGGFSAPSTDSDRWTTFVGHRIDPPNSWGTIALHHR